MAPNAVLFMIQKKLQFVQGHLFNSFIPFLIFILSCYTTLLTNFFYIIWYDDVII